MVIKNLVRNYYIEAIFLLGLIGTTASLYVSISLSWTVCTLCWVQRIFLYPIPLIAGAAILWEKKDLMKAILPLSSLGAFFSTYHYVAMVTDPTRTCGFIIPCSMPNRLYFLTPLQPRTLPLSGIILFSLITALIVYNQTLVKD